MSLFDTCQFVGSIIKLLQDEIYGLPAEPNIESFLGYDSLYWFHESGGLGFYFCWLSRLYVGR